MLFTQTYLNREKSSKKSIIGTNVPYWAIIMIGVIILSYTVYRVRINAYSATDQSIQKMNLANLEVVQPSLLLSDVLAASDGIQINKLLVTVTIMEDVEPLEINSNNLTIDYRDHVQQVSNIPWQWKFLHGSDGDMWIEDGEQIQLQIDIQKYLTEPLIPGTEFVLDIKPATKSILTLHYTVPEQLNSQFHLQ